jgi:lysophospholipase L1-like esterase
MPIPPLPSRRRKPLPVERLYGDPDGQHFNAQGHAAFAAWLAPQVMAAARGK